MQALQLKNPEGMSLYAENWPIENPRAVIALVHGQGEHIGRYPHLFKWFNARGFAIVGVDIQGHGQSDGQRGHAKALDSLLDDIDTLVQETKRLYPNLPLFLYGHSMGGNLCLNYTIRKNPQMKGLIVTGPWIRLAFEAPFLKVLIGKILRNFLPTLSLPTGLTAQFLSHDEKVVKAYLDDPLVHAKLSASEGIFMMEGAEFLNRFDGQMPVTTLIMHGEEDKIISPKASKEFSERVKGDVIHKFWPGLYHEIHNEPSHEVVFQYTLEWLDKNLPTT